MYLCDGCDGTNSADGTGVGYRLTRKRMERGGGGLIGMVASEGRASVTILVNSDGRKNKKMLQKMERVTNHINGRIIQIQLLSRNDWQL